MAVRLRAIVRTIDESKRLLDAMDKKSARVLVRTGGYGRGVYRRLIRRSAAVSAPGNPPHAHAPGNSGMKDTEYQVKGVDSVTIGPLKHPSSPGTTSPSGVRRRVRSRMPVPQLLNEGGGAVMEVDDPLHGSSVVPMNYKPRPFRTKALNPTYEFFKKLMAKERL